MFKIKAFYKGSKTRCFRTWHYESKRMFDIWLRHHRRLQGGYYDIVGFRYRSGRWETLK